MKQRTYSRLQIMSAYSAQADENRYMDMKLFLEETFANYQKLIENSSVAAKKIKDKLTIVDVENSKIVDT